MAISEPVVLTERERAILEHALGLDRVRVSYRNHYTAGCGSTDMQECLSLVAKGLMAEWSASEGLVTFYVTGAGRAALMR